MKNILESIFNYTKGIGYFPDWHIWDLKSAIAVFMVPRLRAYKKFVLSGKMQSLPEWISETNHHSLTEGEQLESWAAIIEDMIFPFELQIKPEHFSNIPESELESRKEKGLELFAKYYNHLWD